MKLPQAFYQPKALTVAPKLLGKVLIRRFESGQEISAVITETEAYCGETDLASHARFGKTKRTAIMYGPPGFTYMYLIYGIYWMLNIVVATKGDPQAVLIRGLRLLNPSSNISHPSSNLNGPGKLTRALNLDKSFNGEDLVNSQRLWLKDVGIIVGSNHIKKTPRIGIDYAGAYAQKPWRFVLT